jgi:hypothetical protein
MITAIILVTSTKARRNSYSFVGGAVLATAIATSVFYYVAKVLKLKASNHGSSSMTVDWVLVVVLVLVAIGLSGAERSRSRPNG